MSEITPKSKSRTNNIFTVLGQYFSTASLYFYIGLIWCKNLVLFRKLKVQSGYIQDSVVIQGNLINLMWDVKGCHMIRVENMGIFPGNIHGIRYVFDNNINPLHIIFYGIFNHKEQILYVRNTEIKVLDTFAVGTQIPSASYHLQQISVPRIQLSPIRIDLKLPSVVPKFKNVEITLDDFKM